jgi:YesN/AraC family two-component response regulator
VVLVVEDNVEIRDFIRLMLGEQYEVLEAADGQAGLAKALDTVPDAVICDIMMPGIDGLELTRTLKADDRTSHVPIIILTAKMGTESRIEGLTAGADAYITKPFSTQELNITLDNLLDSRKQLRTRYSRSVLPDAVKVDEPSMDDRFLQRVRDCVHRHLADEDFDMETLAREVGLSRAQLHRKLTALTGRSATRFVRAYRMEHAHAMLKANVGNISEVAYRVGYPNAAYFTRCFTEDFGYSPSKLRTEHQHRN